MKRKEGFTIVELIIVIAVIGVLAAILIPTFANVIEKANAKSALADARNMLTAYLAEQIESDSMKESIVIFVKKAKQYYVYGYAVGEGKLQISSRNPFQYENLADLVAAENTTHNPSVATDGSFYLVPSNTNPYGLKSAPRLRGIEEDYVPIMLEDAPVGTETYWGALVAGTYGIDDGDDDPNTTDNPNATDEPNNPPNGDSKYALSVMVVPNGAATAVINPTTEEAYDAGTTVELSFTQTPAQAEQYSFVRYSVSGAEISAATTCSVTMDANKAVVINFASGAWDGTEETNDAYGGGSGTRSDPYVITTPQQLYHLSVKVNGGTTYSGMFFVLGNDIILNDGTISSTSTDALAWTPIGNSSKTFQGNFDGQGNAVSGIYINGSNYRGLFGHINNATISNVVVSNSYIAGTQYIGGISGLARNSTITHCANFATIAASTNRGGGIIGSNYASNSVRGVLTISQCINGGNVSGSNVGGIIGYDSCGGEISECVNTGAISGSTVLGGIGGYVRGGVDDAEYSSCYNMGAVSGTGDYVGGIMGQIYNLAYVYGSQCYNAGTVNSSGSTKYGAFMGGGGGASYISNLSSNVDLDSACDQGSGTTPTAEADLKALPAALGDKYMLDNTPNINNGFPILIWQSTGNIIEPENGGGGGGSVVIPVTYTLMYMDGTQIVASETHKENDNVTVRAALADKEGFKFTEWKNGGMSHRPGSSFTMPASDYIMSADWMSIPAGEYYYEMRYVVGSGSNYTIITSTTGTAAEGATIAYDASVLSGEYAGFSIIEPESPFVIQNNNNNLFIVYCAQGISTAEQFDAIRNGLGGTYTLLNDIDLSDYAAWNAIGHTSGSDGYPFTGTLNGNGHTITGVNIPTSSYSGLIFDNQGTIENLYVEANNFTSAGSTGVLVCQNSADGVISKCGVSGTITVASGNYWYTGGIAAYNMGTIDQCWSNVSITATGAGQYYNGCLTGHCSGTISNCIAFGSIYGPRSAGITGYADGCTIEYTYSICKIDAASGETWTKHTWGEAGSINPGRGVYNQKGLVYRAGATSTQWDTYTGDNYANHQYAYGQALTGLDTEGQWTVERFTTNGYSTDIWNLADGQYPTLKNNPVTDGLTVAPPVAPNLP